MIARGNIAYSSYSNRTTRTTYVMPKYCLCVGEGSYPTRVLRRCWASVDGGYPAQHHNSALFARCKHRCRAKFEVELRVVCVKYLSSRQVSVIWALGIFFGYTLSMHLSCLIFGSSDRSSGKVVLKVGEIFVQSESFSFSPLHLRVGLPGSTARFSNNVLGLEYARQGKYST